MLTCIQPTDKEPIKEVCRHCQARPVSRSRGLCNRCYKNMDIRNLYHPNLRRGPSPVTKVTPTGGLGKPTHFLPGTPEKVGVMAERAQNGLSIFHPMDATWEGYRARGTSKVRHA
jgi:hypothetical protein